MESEEAVPHSSSSSSPGNHREGIQPGERVRAPGRTRRERGIQPVTLPLSQRLVVAARVCRWQTRPLPTASPGASPAVKSSNSVAAARSPTTPSSLSGYVDVVSE